jgi:hypothetical protein
VAPLLQLYFHPFRLLCTSLGKYSRGAQFDSLCALETTAAGRWRGCLTLEERSSIRSCSGSVYLSLVSVNTRNPIGMFAHRESNDHPSHLFYTGFMKNSPGGTASASNELAASPTKQVISQQIGLDLESKGVA